MSSKGLKLSLESYFKLDIDHVLPSESSIMDETHTKPKSNVSEFQKAEEYLTKQMESKKSFLIEFTERTADIYATKFGELLHKHEREMDAFKNEFLQNLRCEMEKWRSYINFIRQEEKKLMKQLIYLRKVYNSSEIKNRGIRKIVDIHKSFFQKYEDLLLKHGSEVKSLAESINEEVGRIKQNLSREFCKKESEMMKNSLTTFCAEDNFNI